MNSSAETRPPKQPIFVLGVQRSGTVLVQRLLNSHEDVLIWGEHHGALKWLAESFFRLVEGDPGGKLCLMERVGVDWRSLPEDKGNWSDQCWLNWFEYEDLVRVFRGYVEELFHVKDLAPKVFRGFKEIRCGFTDRAIEFLSTLFPEAIFVFVVRNGFNVLASYRSHLLHCGLDCGLERCKEFCTAWRSMTGTYWRWHTSGRSKSFWIVFEDLIRAEGKIHELLESMGKHFGARQRAVLERKLGRGTLFEDEDVLQRSRHLPPAWFSIASALLGDTNQRFGFPNPPLRAFHKPWGNALVWGVRIRGWIQRSWNDGFRKSFRLAEATARPRRALSKKYECGTERQSEVLS